MSIRVRNHGKGLSTFNPKSYSKMQSLTETTKLWRITKKNLVPATISFFLLLACSSVMYNYQIFPKTTTVDETELQFHQQWSLQCSQQNQTQTCPTMRKQITHQIQQQVPSCPEYFRWIHEDLKPWKEVGITKELVDTAYRVAHGPVRLVIFDGRVYVKKQKRQLALANRDTFTIWGILQLLRFYPGTLPDLEMVFDHTDQPYVLFGQFGGDVIPPPLFKYCGSNSSFDIVFPDASFWNWPKSNMRPWNSVLRDIKVRNQRIEWKDRLPYAYWRGSTKTIPTRIELLKCNFSQKNDWKTYIYNQDWDQEIRERFPKSNIAGQCTHRYKIYIQGYTWSVSAKYILACDSMTLYINSQYYDIFSRGLMPLKHYWPIRDDKKCPSLKFAVNWGNNHPEKAMEIGKNGSNFIEENLNMELVYNYMFHLLNEYAKLLKYKPEIPSNAMELCAENLMCPIKEGWKRRIIESFIKTPSNRMPCTLPNPYSLEQIQLLLESKANASRKVEMWEDEYWRSVHY